MPQGVGLDASVCRTRRIVRRLFDSRTDIDDSRNSKSYLGVSPKEKTMFVSTKKTPRKGFSSCFTSDETTDQNKTYKDELGEANTSKHWLSYDKLDKLHYVPKSPAGYNGERGLFRAARKIFLEGQRERCKRMVEKTANLFINCTNLFVESLFGSFRLTTRRARH